MRRIRRRGFLKNATAFALLGDAVRRGTALAAEAPRAGTSPVAEAASPKSKGDSPARIPNEYTLFLPGERECLESAPQVDSFGPVSLKARLKGEVRELRLGESIGGWQLVAILPSLNRIPTAVFERHVTHQGALAYVTTNGKIAHIPKRVGDLSKIRPRPVNAPPETRFERPARYLPAPDKLGDFILNSAEDPCYENVAALGAEMIGWTLVANEEAGPEKSLWLEASGVSRQFGTDPASLWAPDLTGRLFEPHRLLPTEYAYEYEYVHGFSKRTLLGGFLPAADIGVYNPRYGTGYEVMMILPSGEAARPLGRLRAMALPAANESPEAAGNKSLAAAPFTNCYWNGSGEEFYSEVVGIWNHWNDFFNQKMQVEIPDEWLLDAARAGIVLSRCSYHGLNPSYQIGEGAYTFRLDRSPAIFPVSFCVFVWAHQLWNLTEEVQPYFEHYLENYILPDGNFLYNKMEQVEAPLNAGIFLENSARAYDYARDIEALQRRLPVLRRMIDFLLKRYHYSKAAFPHDDPRHGLIWGSPEADNGMPPRDDFPESHPYYYQNSSWTWRGLHEHARCLARAAAEHEDDKLRRESEQVATVAAEMRADIQRSLNTALAARNPEMKAAGITPFTPFDTRRTPSELGMYENNRFMTEGMYENTRYMMDWWTSDWGDPALDEGHFKHRILAGEQLLGMSTNGQYPQTRNSMEYATLAARIRQDDYRPFLLTLYADACYAMDCGNRYSPENALVPGTYPGEDPSTAGSPVVNSELEPTLGLRWLLCYEEHDRDIVHLQKAAPQHWFNSWEKIRVWNCPTRFGHLSWTTESVSSNHGGPRWHVDIEFEVPFSANLVVHVHPPGRVPLRATSIGELHKGWVVLPASLLVGKTKLGIEIS